MRVLVTGIGRSGTGYASQLLTRAGLKCGHEAVFGPKTLTAAAALERSKQLQLAGESSFYAVPFLSELPDDIVICHQLRHPRSWIGSWCAPRSPATLEFLRRCFGPYSHTPEEAAQLWIRYNAFVRSVRSDSRGYVAYRAKDAPRVLSNVLKVPWQTMRHADAATSKNYNHRKRSSVTLRQVSDETVARLELAWREYGFQW